MEKKVIVLNDEQYENLIERVYSDDFVPTTEEQEADYEHGSDSFFIIYRHNYSYLVYKDV